MINRTGRSCQKATAAPAQITDTTEYLLSNSPTHTAASLGCSGHNQWTGSAGGGEAAETTVPGPHQPRYTVSPK